jgi:hypothetical protein
MRKRFFITLSLLLVSLISNGQDFGLSFSYFLPKNGYFSTPISPFSIRGLGVNLNRFVSLEAGASLYRMSGMNVKDIPFESKEPLTGPNFTIFVPVEIVFSLQASRIQFDIKGGGFFFHGFDNKINYGNFDRAILEHVEPSWTVANADLKFKNQPGFGYHGGAELTIYVTPQVGVSIETNYLVGESKFPLTGNYTGGGTTIETKDVDYADAKIDFTGLEFSIGLIFSSNNSGQPSGPKRRRR